MSARASACVRVCVRALFGMYVLETSRNTGFPRPAPVFWKRACPLAEPVSFVSILAGMGQSGGGAEETSSRSAIEDNDELLPSLLGLRGECQRGCGREVQKASADTILTHALTRP